MFTRVKSIVLALVLLIPLIIPFGQTAQAYGVANHENVIDIGKNHFVVLKNDGSVWSWGDHEYGQLGVRLSSLESDKPSAIRKQDGNRLANIKSIAAGGDHTVALDKNNEVWTWGRNSDGQLGYTTPFIGTTDQMTYNAEPTKVMKNTVEALKAIAISAGEVHTLAVDESGQVWAWGSGKFGQIGKEGRAITPELVPGLSNIVAVAAGAHHSLALSRDGKVFAWGRNTNGQLGIGQSGHINPMPKQIERLTGIMEIAAGDNHTIALAQNRTTIWAWGSNFYGQLGDGGREERLHPVTVEGIQGVKMIAAGNDHTIAVKDDGSVWTWGRNTSGTKEARTTPIQIKGVNNAFAIGGGGANINSYTLAIHHDGTVWKWDQESYDSTSKLPIFKPVSGIDEVMKKIDYPFVQGGQVLFKYIGTSDIVDVQVSGSFNEWDDIPLVRSGNEWTLQDNLPPGKYEYGFRVNGKWMSDPLNIDRGNSSAGEPISYLTVDQYATEGPIIDDKEVTFTYSSHDYNGLLEFDAETSYVAVKGEFSDWVEIPMKRKSNNTWVVTRTLPPGDYYYDFVVRDSETGAVAKERLDPLNPNVVELPISREKRNVFTVSEQILTKVPVENVEIDRGSTMNMVVGEQTMLRALISPSNATDKTVSWRSSDSSVVSVEEGILTAHSQGLAVISVTSVYDGSKSDMITVFVEQQDGAIGFPRPGYETFDAKTNVEPNKVWYIRFNEELDINSVNRNNVYIENEVGERVSVGHEISDDAKTLEIRLQGDGAYTLGATYYLFIENTVKTKYSQKNLKKKYQMQFQIRL
ncbi:RCC1 domain-containing protein [Sporosarcina sp. FSL K6-3457]|uniref:RCC1 domain-containing protein n=1 Tax=Sporosarcina sp. FSL K6-3457 TaxID=2978204 RepID=UPI0030FCCA84